VRSGFADLGLPAIGDWQVRHWTQVAYGIPSAGPLAGDGRGRPTGDGLSSQDAMEALRVCRG